MARSVDDFIIDFSKEEQGAGGGIRVKPGKRRAKILAAKPTTASEKGTPGLELTLSLVDEGKKKLRDTLWATPKAYGRFRTLLEACGKKVPQRVNLVKIATAVKGCEVVIDVDDEERPGYPTRSRVTFEGYIHPDDWDEDEEDDEDEDEDLDEDEDEEPAPKRRRRRAKPEPEDEDDEDEDDEDDEDEDEEPPKRRRTRKPAAKKPRRRKPADDDEDDLDDLDLDEL